MFAKPACRTNCGKPLVRTRDELLASTPVPVPSPALTLAALGSEVQRWVAAAGVMGVSGAGQSVECGIPDDMEVVAEDRCQLLQLPYFQWHWVVFDPMHTIGGVILDVVWHTLHEPRWSEKVQACERWLGRWVEGPPAQLDAHEIGILHGALQDMAESFPGRGGLGRLWTLLSPGESLKTHALFLLGGPVGLYALGKVLKSVGPSSNKGRVIEVLMQVL